MNLRKSAIFQIKITRREKREEKNVKFVDDLLKSFPRSIWSLNLALIQPRAGRSKFENEKRVSKWCVEFVRWRMQLVATEVLRATTAVARVYSCLVRFVSTFLGQRCSAKMPAIRYSSSKMASWRFYFSFFFVNGPDWCKLEISSRFSTPFHRMNSR